jgi:small subunit ribosomal protein S14
MKYINFKDKLCRERVSSSEVSRKLLLYIRRVYGSTAATHLLEKLAKEGAFVSRIQRPCIVTGRNKSVLRRYRVSRIEIRRLLSKGSVPGLRKSSW